MWGLPLQIQTQTTQYRERERERKREKIYGEQTRSWDLHVFIAQSPANMDHANPCFLSLLLTLTSKFTLQNQNKYIFVIKAIQSINS